MVVDYQLCKIYTSFPLVLKQADLYNRGYLVINGIKICLILMFS